jgi:aryl-alcohol dehydrogenase-like predicted oxidoreductase
VIRREKPDFMQVNYSLAEPDAGLRLLPVARELGVAVLVNRPFTKGSMIDRAAGKPLPPLATELGVASAAQLFLKWVLGDPAGHGHPDRHAQFLACARKPRGRFRARAGCVAEKGHRRLVRATLTLGCLP